MDAFQGPDMVNFFTYETSTSLNMFKFLALKSTIPFLKSKQGKETSIVKELKTRKGMRIPETSLIFTFSAVGALGWGVGLRGVHVTLS
jgi:hypothetical protein